MTGFIDRRIITNFDWSFLLTIILLSIAGLYSVYAAVNNSGQIELFWRQVTWFFLGLFIMFVVLLIDYNYWAQFAYLFYCITIVLLILLFFQGVTSNGDVNRWLKFGSLPQIQPSEFIKLALIMVLSKYFHSINKFRLTITDLIVPIIITSIPFFLVVSQPDLGTALSLVPIVVLLFYVAGYRFKSMMMWAAFFSIPAVIAAKYILKPYQLKRLTTFINPQADIQGAGWHTVMSKISVGSGGLIGKTGEQVRLYERGFLPEQHTDFIFSVWAEETGFVGCMIVIFLFVLLLRKGILIAMEAKEPLGIYLTTGILAMIAFQAFFNIGMAMGLLPITGLPLPFFSYGGSHQMTTFISIGIILNIRMRRYMF